MPLPPGHQPYSERFIDATRVAARMHADQLRKGTTIPYVSHLFGTCSIALEYGANEDQAIAALLHDAIEDIEPIDQVRAAVGEFGAEVLRIVEACTDSDEVPKPPWRERKERYVARLATRDAPVLLVSASDKLHNARAIVRDLRGIGPAVWDRFDKAGDPLWYYRASSTAFRANPAHVPALIDELDRTVTEMERLSAGSPT